MLRKAHCSQRGERHSRRRPDPSATCGFGFFSRRRSGGRPPYPDLPITGVIQLGVVIVLIPVAIYLFSTADTTTAVGFLIWAILVAPIDNILKPMLLGRGVDVPMLVIFVGAIGGFLSSGIIGLFLGAVVLALGYKLFLVWLKQEETHSSG